MPKEGGEESRHTPPLHAFERGFQTSSVQKQKRHKCEKGPFFMQAMPPFPNAVPPLLFFHLSPRYNIPRTSVDDSGARVTCKANISIETSIPSIFSFHTIPLPVPDASHIQRVFSREVRNFISQKPTSNLTTSSNKFKFPHFSSFTTQQLKFFLLTTVF